MEGRFFKDNLSVLGDVGIGINNPQRSLTLYRASTTVLQLVNSTTGTGNSDGFLLTQGGLNTTIENSEAGYMAFRTSADEKMRITSSGNVGIGTTAPTKKLDVNGDVKIAGDTLNAGFLQAYGSNYSVGNNNYGVFLGTYSGGTSISPGEVILSTQGKSGWAVGDGLGRIRFFLGDSSGIGVRDVAKIEALSEDGNGTTASAGLAFHTSPYNSQVVERVRIDKDGNVGIGTTSPSSLLNLNDASNNLSHQIGFSYVNGGTKTDAFTIGRNSSTGNLEFHSDINNHGFEFKHNAAGTQEFNILNMNVGIGGTPNSSYKLDVSGDTLIQESESGDLKLVVNNISTSTLARSFVSLINDSGSTAGLILPSTNYTGVTGWANRLILNTDSNISNGILVRPSNGGFTVSSSGIASNDLVVEDGTGYVGIGTATPSAKLQVAGNTYLNSGSNVWNLIGNNGINFARETYFGYSSSYRILQLGTIGASRAISIGVDVSSNASGSFGGDEIIFPNQREIITPNAADNGYLGLIATDNHNKVRIGNYRWNILNDTPGITIDTSASTNYVGIGTTSPTTRLQVKDSVDNTYESGFSVVRSADGATTWINLQGGATNFNNKNHAGNAGLKYRWFQNSSEKMTLDTNGNLGIGTTSPSFLLHLQHATNPTIRVDNTVNNSRLDLRAEDSAVLIRSTSNFPMRFDVNQTERMRIDTAGNVGIGNANPQTKLELYGEQYSTNYPSMLSILDTTTAFDTDNNGGGISFGAKYTSSSDVRFLAGIQGVKANNTSGNFGGALRFLIRENGTSILSEKMRVGSTGNVGIGTTDPAGKLHIYNTAETSDRDGTATPTASGQDSILLYGHGGFDTRTYGAITWMGGTRRRAMITAVAENNDVDYLGLAFYTQGVDGAGDFNESMRISHGGNVGIGNALNPLPKTYMLLVAP